MSIKPLRATPVILSFAIALLGFGVASPGGVGAWLTAEGIETRYPSTGGKWEYGFINAKVRSYYTVNQCHGSSVRYNGSLSRSVDTAGGYKSIAEKWAYQHRTATDEYYYRVC